MMKTKMLMIVVAFKSQNQFCWNLHISDGEELPFICVKNYLSVDGNGDGDPDDNGDDDAHQDGGNLIL